MNIFNKIGFIGCGNMASAIIGGIVKSGKFSPQNICVYDISIEATKNAADNFGVTICDSAIALTNSSDLIIIAVKPQFCADVISDIRLGLSKDKALLSIAAGKSIAFFTDLIGKDIPIIRAMPNTPALVSEAMTSLSPNSLVTDAQISEIKELFESFGKAEVIPENLIDAVVGVSGSSPAYVFMFIEAMADGAVKAGMSRELAYKFASQAVMGSAKMVLETGMHPAALKDMVCSPGGTTIEAVQALEETGLRASVMQAMEACIKKLEKL